MTYPTKKLGEIFDITSSKRVFKADWKNKGIPFYRAREIVKLARDGFVNNDLFITEEMFSEYSKKYGIPQEGDIMITGVGTLGVCYLVREDDNFYFKDGNIIWLKKKSDNVSSIYIEYGFQSEIIKKQVNQTTGTSVGTYTIIRAKNTKIPLPPLQTQKGIVAKLDSAFEKIDASIKLVEENLRGLEEMNASVLEGIISNNISKLKTIEEVCYKITDGVHNTPKYVSEGVPFLSVKDVTKGFIDFSNTRFISREEHDNLVKRCNPELGDMLYTKVGTTGYAKSIDVEKEFSIFVSLALLKFDKKILDTKYFEYILNSPNVYKQSQKGTRGVTNKNLVLRDIKTIKIPLPPLEKQKEIVEYLDKVYEKNRGLKGMYEEKLGGLKEMKQSLLREAFEGRLVSD